MRIQAQTPVAHTTRPPAYGRTPPGRLMETVVGVPASADEELRLARERVARARSAYLIRKEVRVPPCTTAAE